MASHSLRSSSFLIKRILRFLYSFKVNCAHQDERYVGMNVTVAATRCVRACRGGTPLQVGPW